MSATSEVRDSGQEPADPVTAYLAEVREREQAATKGPWRTHDTWLESGGHSATVLSGEGNATDLRAWLPTFAGGLAAWDEGRNTWNDAAFIAAARSAVPRLLAAVEAVRDMTGEPGALISCERIREAISAALLGEGETDA